MTCIVGLIHNGTVYMGGDSAGVGGYDLTIRKDEKVFENGEFLIGFTSSFRMGQLLRYKFKPPYHIPDMPTEEYMATLFVDAVRSCLKEGGYAKTQEGEESGGTFLVGYRGRLFSIQDDFQIGESMHGYDAVGCGRNIALGCLYANGSMRPKDRVYQALQAAECFSAGVRKPFVIKNIGGDRQ